MGSSALRKLKKAAGLACRGTFRRAAWHGVAAATEHREVLSRLPFETVVDIGANRGQFALVCRDLAPSAVIHSFEPLASAFAVLEKVFAGDSSAKLYASAIGLRDGLATIHVSSREDSSSLLPIGEEQSRHFPGTGESHTEEIRVAPLSAFLSAVDLAAPSFLKIDVQGYELTVLEGCESLLDHFAYIYVECSFVELYRGQAFAADVIEFLSTKRFVLRGVYNVTYDVAGTAIQADFLFQKSP